MAKKVTLKTKMGKQLSLEWWNTTIQQYQNNKTFEARRYNKMNRRHIAPGALIAYKYQAKGASKLPFWDKNPLVVLFSENGRYFVGLNLHYIHPKFRPTLLKYVIKLNKLRIKKDRRFHLEWRDLKTFITRNNLKISIRKYIKGRMSSVTYIRPKEWVYAAQLPSEKFVFNGSMDRDKLYQLIQHTGKRG